MGAEAYPSNPASYGTHTQIYNPHPAKPATVQICILQKDVIFLKIIEYLQPQSHSDGPGI
jgi:hypothetical protein